MPLVPDLVRDSKLETRFHHNKYTIHKHYDESSQSNERINVREECWKRVHTIGSGGHGTVWLETCIKGEKDLGRRAVKQILKPRARTEAIDYNRELEAIAKFSHYKYVHCFVKSFGWFDRNDSLCITMEYFPAGDLQSHLSSCPQLPESEVQQITTQVLEGLRFLHDNDFAHRDLKPQNILIKYKPPEAWWVKIGDFGISRRFEDDANISTSVKGTLGFMSPEMHGFVAQTPGISMEDTLHIHQLADIWALGELAFRMLAGRPCFKDLSLLSRYTTGAYKFPRSALEELSVSPVGVDFVARLMAASTADRLSADEAWHHRWVESYRLDNPTTDPIAVSGSTGTNDSSVESQKIDSVVPTAKWTSVSGATVSKTSRKPQRKVRSACDNCHQTKVKCTGGNPCSWCNTLELPCVYSVSNRTGRPRGTKNKKTIERQKREAAIANALNAEAERFELLRQAEATATRHADGAQEVEPILIDSVSPEDGLPPSDPESGNSASTQTTAKPVKQIDIRMSKAIYPAAKSRTGHPLRESTILKHLRDDICEPVARYCITFTGLIIFNRGIDLGLQFLIENASF